ncbi:MAG: SDR family NAD(P)-dependent oxidoreductase [Streptosporangiaceae bacterium]
MTEPSATALEGRAAVVTGGGRGLGRSLALALADAGAAVAVAGRDAASLDTTVKEISDRGRWALAVPTDVTDGQAVERLIDTAVRELGRLDVLVNNAGVLHGADLIDTTDEQWDTVVDTNLRGTFLATRAAGRHLTRQGSGKVINVSSNFAFIGVPRFASYCASKGAIVAFTKAMAVEWAPFGVQVNALAPGYFGTDMNAGARDDPALGERIVRQIPARRLGEPDELRGWVVLLASPASDFMTGATIVIDGGQLAR